MYSVYSEALSHLETESNVNGFLDAFEPMLPAINDFFNNVMVNVENEDLRKNRLGLLQGISAMQDGRADLSYLSGF